MTYILKFRGGLQYFMRLDLSDSYLQVPLDKESQRLMTMNTYKGLFYVYSVLFWYCFFTRSISIIDQLIQGIPKTVAYLNDIVILRRTMEEHNGNLHAVLKRLQDAGFSLKGNKCEFKNLLFSYLGHRIDAEGIYSTQYQHYSGPIVTSLLCLEEVVLSMSVLDLTPVTSKTIAFYTAKDPLLSQACKWILQGWPDFQTYTTRKD